MRGPQQTESRGFCLLPLTAHGLSWAGKRRHYLWAAPSLAVGTKREEGEAFWPQSSHSSEFQWVVEGDPGGTRYFTQSCGESLLQGWE